jgi:hypothetical protein
VKALSAAILPSCAAVKVFSSSGRFAQRCLGARSNARGLQADRIFRLCLLVLRADRHRGPARVLVSARVRRRTDLFPHDLVAFANAGALLSSSLREPPNEEPTHLLVVIDAGLKLSPAREAEAGWQGALATTSAPNVWVLGREPDCADGVLWSVVRRGPLRPPRTPAGQLYSEEALRPCAGLLLCSPPPGTSG